MTKPKKDERKQLQEWITFLEKRLASKSYKANAHPAEYEKSKQQLKKARFRLKTMK